MARQQIRVRYQKGYHIRKLREHQGISQEQLAADAEILIAA